MDRTIVYTKDGSPTLLIPGRNISYRSMHGAIGESKHVFITAGFLQLNRRADPVSIFEMGLGTGLNALLTLIEAERLQQPVHYTALELFPVETAQAVLLNYCELLGRPDLAETFQQLHSCEWEKEICITPFFSMQKINRSFHDFTSAQKFNLIYYDAFSPVDQPELWTKDIFDKLFVLSAPGGLLLTYSSKATVRKAMQEAGFMVEKIPGPQGKREIVRAYGSGRLNNETASITGNLTA